METMHQIVLQEWNEEKFNRKHIDAKIRACITDPADTFMQDKLATCAKRIEEHIAKAVAGEYHASKNRRIIQLAAMDTMDLTVDLLIGLAYFQVPELFTSATAQMSSRLRLSDRVEAIHTVSELLAILCHEDVCDIYKEERAESLKLVSRIPLSQSLLEFIDRSSFLPPMVCEPLPLTHNFSSGYLTHNDSLVLGSGNHHDGDLCLDVLNLMNRVPLKLDIPFLSQVEEEPTYEFDNQMQMEQWTAFKRQSTYFYLLLSQQGNRFYFNNKVDKRGRIYAHGYHLNPQGTPFKKAMLEFADEELVEGVPT